MKICVIVEIDGDRLIQCPAVSGCMKVYEFFNYFMKWVNSKKIICSTTNYAKLHLISMGRAICKQILTEKWSHIKKASKNKADNRSFVHCSTLNNI